MRARGRSGPTSRLPRPRPRCTSLTVSPGGGASAIARRARMRARGDRVEGGADREIDGLVLANSEGYDGAGEPVELLREPVGSSGEGRPTGTRLRPWPSNWTPVRAVATRKELHPGGG